MYNKIPYYGISWEVIWGREHGYWSAGRETPLYLSGLVRVVLIEEVNWTNCWWRGGGGSLGSVGGAPGDSSVHRTGTLQCLVWLDHSEPGSEVGDEVRQVTRGPLCKAWWGWGKKLADMNSKLEVLSKGMTCFDLGFFRSLWLLNWVILSGGQFCPRRHLQYLEIF